MSWIQPAGCRDGTLDPRSCVCLDPASAEYAANCGTPAPASPCNPCADNQPRAQSIRKGTYEMNAVFTGLTGELVAVLTKDRCNSPSSGHPCVTLAVHDGATAGGHLLMRRDFGCFIPGSLPAGLIGDGLITQRMIGTGAIDCSKITADCKQSLIDQAVTKADEVITFVGRPDTPPDYHTPVPYVGGAILRVRNAGDQVRFADNVRIEGGHLHVNFNPADQAAMSTASTLGLITAWDGGALQWRVGMDGATYANGPYSGSGADYAERFESLSGATIPPGTVVVLDQGKVRPATAGDDPDDILGVIRPEGAAGMVGNDAALTWADKYLTDTYGAPVLATQQVWRWFDEAFDANRSVPASGPDRPAGVPETAELVAVNVRVINPAFDPSVPYIPRSQRPEWVVVGLLGQIPITNGQPVHGRWRLMTAGPVAGLWLVR